MISFLHGNGCQVCPGTFTTGDYSTLRAGAPFYKVYESAILHKPKDKLYTDSFIDFSIVAERQCCNPFFWNHVGEDA